MRHGLPARLVSSLILLGAATLGFARPAVTGAQSLNPPPPPFVTCKATGSGAICSGSYAFDGQGVIAATDNICGFDIVYQTSGTISPILWYDQSGNLVKEFDRGSIIITYSADGRSLTSLDIAYPHFNYVDGVVKVTGMEEVWKIPGQQPVVTSGQMEIDLNTGDVIVEHGVFSDSITPAMCAYFSGS